MRPLGIVIIAAIVFSSGMTATAISTGTMTETFFAATSIEKFNSLVDLLGSGDDAAFDKAFAKAVMAGEATSIEKGTEVYVEGYGGWSDPGIIKVRLPGDDIIYYTSIHLVEI